jgi:preprotein translocase subunit SecG
MTKGVEIFFVLSMLSFVLIFIVKSIIYTILDYRNDYPIMYGRLYQLYIVFWPYDKEVSKKDDKLKRTANYLHKIYILSLIIFVIALILRFINSKH